MNIDATDISHLKNLLKNDNVDQVAFLVEDLKQATQMWDALLGVNDWQIFTYTPDNVEQLTYYGKPADFSMRLALTGRNPQIELIQPLHGRSIYSDWIETHGYGLHHLGFFVSSVKDTMQRLSATGLQIIQSGQNYGVDGDGGFAYFETSEGVKCVLEAIEAPARRRPSEIL